MLHRKINFYRILNRFVTLLAVVFVFLTLVGCAGGNYGTLDRDRDLDKCNEADKENSGKSGRYPYHNSHDQQNQPLSRGKVVKQFCKVTFEH